MLEVGTPADAADWVLELLCFPTFDKPGKEGKNRLTHHLAGHTLLPADEQLEKQLLEALQAEGPNQIKQVSPNEIPTALLNLRGSIITIEKVFSEVLRAAGCSVMASKAPRGNLARRLGGGRKR